MAKNLDSPEALRAKASTLGAERELLLGRELANRDGKKDLRHLRPLTRVKVLTRLLDVWTELGVLEVVKARAPRHSEV